MALKITKSKNQQNQLINQSVIFSMA